MVDFVHGHVPCNVTLHAVSSDPSILEEPAPAIYLSASALQETADNTGHAAYCNWAVIWSTCEELLCGCQGGHKDFSSRALRG